MRSLIVHISVGLTLILLTACQIKFSEADGSLVEGPQVCTLHLEAALNLTVLLPKRRRGCPDVSATASTTFNGVEYSEVLADLSPYLDDHEEFCQYNFVGAYEWIGEVNFEIEKNGRPLVEENTVTQSDGCHVIGQAFTYDMSDD